MASQTVPSQSDTILPNWSRLSGRVLEGGFELQDLLEADQSEARFKVRVLGDRDLDCVARLFQLTPELAAGQVELWEFTRQLRHPHLSAPIGSGQVAIDGSNAAYVVVRRADESLDAVLSERALTVEEAGEVLGSVAQALEVLHLNGLAYGCLSPSRVLAVGESIKIPAECVRIIGAEPAVQLFTPAYLAPESASGNVTAAADLWSLGATLFEALTQKPWNEDWRDATEDLPEPFASIALRCLHEDPEGRASLGEVMALHRGELKPVPRSRAALEGRTTTVIVPEAALLETAAAEPVSGVEEHAEIAQASPVDERRAEAAPAVSATVDSAVLASPIVAEEAKIEKTEEPTAPPVYVEGLDPKQDTDSLQSAPARAKEAPASGEPYLTRPKTAASAEPLGPLPGMSFDDAVRAGTRSRRLDTEEGEGHGVSPWLWAGIALMVVLGLIWGLRPKSNKVVPGPKAPQAADSRPAPEAPAPVAKSKEGGSAWETRTLQPDGSASKSAPPAATSSPKPVAKTPAISAKKPVQTAAPVATNAPVASNGSEVWRVISYTYLHREDAEKKMHAINSAHPDLHAEVFSPKGGGSPYLIALGGGRMGKDEAAQVRRKAISNGMPRDSYIQNYKR